MGGGLKNPPVEPHSVRLVGVSIDTRTIEPGELFVAIKGPRFDGHDFVEQAFERRAAAAVLESRWGRETLRGPVIEVKNTVEALQRLAAYHREALCATVVAITGSNGKTTTKDLVAHVLAGTRQVGGTQGNLNNHLGVPLTILSLRSSDEAAVIELGASGLGEISNLARLAKPHVGVITNVGPTHLEQMGTVEQVARCKAELVAELSSGGTLVVNGDDEKLLAEIRRAEREDVRIITCGLGPDCMLRVAAWRDLGLDGMEFEVAGWGTARVPTLGRHSITNAVLALAVGWDMGMTFEKMCERLAEFTPPSLRMNCLRLKDLLVLNDCYNSNPASANAALQTLRELPVGGRRVAVLGDMLELGKGSAQFHRELGRAASFVDWLLFTGQWADEVVKGAVGAGLGPDRAGTFADRDSLTSALVKGLRPGDVVLIKGSRAVGLEHVTRTLEREFADTDDSHSG
jgi:UDP-N-acetylmuramoyl-tripeptide--D-alanyl-D-alanine ligase